MNDIELIKYLKDLKASVEYQLPTETINEDEEFDQYAIGHAEGWNNFRKEVLNLLDDIVKDINNSP